MAYLEIVEVLGREILDSRGNPTVEAEVYFETALSAGEHPRAALQPENSRRSS